MHEVGGRHDLIRGIMGIPPVPKPHLANFPEPERMEQRWLMVD